MRKRLYIVSLITALIWLPCIGTPAASAHTFHTSLMQLEYNEQEKTVEISIEVFAHDLEDVLSSRSGRHVMLDRTPDADKLALAYLQDTVTLKNGAGEIKALSWVGMESKADAVWLYVEAQMPEGLQGAQLRDGIFFELLDDQVNLVHVKHGSLKMDLVFKRGDEFKALIAQARE